MINIAINGFGRIGRNFLRSIFYDPDAKKKLSVVAINVGPTSQELAAYLFTYDSIMGRYSGNVQLKNGKLIVDGHEIALISELDPARANWKQFNVDWVVESSGKFTNREGAEKHLEAGAGAVLISAPAKNEDVTIIPGVNSEAFDKANHKIVSLGSCTTNAVVPMLNVLHNAFVVEQGFMTTIHAYTNTQVLLDTEAGDERRSRAAALNIIPTTTGATKVVGKVLPELDGKIGGMAVRVPVADVSLIDLSFAAKKELSVQKIIEVFQAAANEKLKHIIAMTNIPLVSSDFIGDPHSVVIDVSLIDVRNNIGKLFGWYDNEWGYSQRMKDFLMDHSG